MKKYIGWSILCLIGLLACSNKQDIVVLEKDTPAYELGKSVAATLPIMDPDANAILVTSDHFQISAGEVVHTIRSFMGNRSNALAQMDAQQMRNILGQTLTELAEKKLLANAAKIADITVSKSQIDSAVNMQYERAGGKDAYLNILSENDIDFNFIQEELVNTILIQKYLSGVMAKEIQVTEAQIAEAYEQFLQDTTVSVQHILLLTENASVEEKRTIYEDMKALLTRARNGEDFGELAKAYSEDPGSKNSGGLYENVERGVMVKSFEQAAFTVPVGSISDIVETRYGYHIVKVVSRKKNDQPLHEVRSDLEATIRTPEQNNVIPAHINFLKEAEHVNMVTL